MTFAATVAGRLSLFPMRNKRKPVTKGSTLPVRLTPGDVLDIREPTFVNPTLLRAGVVEGNGSLRFDWSLEDIEEIQGDVAASANNTKKRKLCKRLESIYSKLQHFLDSYEDQEDSS
jgi:hypothetical protein